MSAVDETVDELLSGAQGGQSAAPAPQQGGGREDADRFLLGSAASATFNGEAPITYRGLIVGEPRKQQQRDFDTNDLLFWDDGSPREQVVVTLQTCREDEQWRDEPIVGDDGERNLYIKGNSQKALRTALRRAGARRLDEGGYLELTWVSTDKPKRKGIQGAKVYEAVYELPGSVKAREYAAVIEAVGL